MRQAALQLEQQKKGFLEERKREIARMKQWYNEEIERLIRKRDQEERLLARKRDEEGLCSRKKWRNCGRPTIREEERSMKKDANCSRKR